MNIIVLIIFVGLINMTFDYTRITFAFQLLFTIVIGFFTIISMLAIFNNARWGWRFIYYIMLLMLIDMLVIYFIKGKPAYFFTISIFSLIGFFMSVGQISKKPKKVMIKEPKAEEVKKKFYPGKFVGSKTASKYHAPNCEWAKKIKKSNQVWFADETEAKKKKYSAHSCVKDKVYKNF